MTGAQMGVGGRSAVSIDMKEVSSLWPLIRHIADQDIYYAAYKKYVNDFPTEKFTPVKIKDIIDHHITLITPFVTGSEPEQTGYTHLKSLTDFTNSPTVLNNHIVVRNQIVQDFLNR